MRARVITPLVSAIAAVLIGCNATAPPLPASVGAASSSPTEVVPSATSAATPSPSTVAVSSPTPSPSPQPSPTPTPELEPTTDPSPTATPATGRLRITSPAEGATVSTEQVTIKGKGPPGATITQDISFAPDQHTTVSGAGTWSLKVRLDAGANTLRFRVGDDQSTAIDLHLTYAPPPDPGADLKSYFESVLDYSFEDAPLLDGTPRQLGSSSDGLLTVEITGRPMKGASVTAPIGSPYSAAFGDAVGAEAVYLEVPDAGINWLSAEIKKAGSRYVNKKATFGRITISLQWDPVTLGFVVVDFSKR